MAISKRTRFEVLRRDSHTCRYCGQCAPDVKLTIDHVIPVALGGTNDPANLVAACADCNAGKSSTSPDAAIVADVDESALRWAAAMKLAAEREASAREATQQLLADFKGCVWDSWTLGADAHKFPLPPDWESGVLQQLHTGLSMDDLKYAVDVTMKKPYVDYGSEFRYFMGVCKGMLRNRAEAAAAILAEEH